MEKEITINELKTIIDELVVFLQENMVTKQDLKEEIKLLATKDELAAFRAEVAQEFESFRAEVGVFKSEFESFRTEVTGEFRMIHKELDDIKERLTKLEKRTIEDADATAKDVIDLRRRVEKLEHQLKQLQAA